MSLRFKSSGIFAFSSLLLVKICQGIELQRYPDGITAIDAFDKCGKSGIENDPSVLTKLTEINGVELWTGLGIFTHLTPWIEIMGCFPLRNRPTKVFHVSSAGLCEIECSTEYFGYSKETMCCSCFNSSDILLTRKTNLSSCKAENDETVLIYKINNGTLIPYETVQGLCSTLKCTAEGTTIMIPTTCKHNDYIQGVCEDGMQSSFGINWGLTQNQTFENCWNQNKLLLNSSACQYFGQSLKSRAWTNVFREEIEVELTLGNTTVLPKFCQSAHISTSDHKGENVLTMYRHHCSTKLEWFVCKKDSTTVQNEYHTDEAKFSSYVFKSSGAVIGGVLGACSMIAVLVMLIVCKVRSKGIFAESNTKDYEDTSHVNFSTTTYDDLDSTKHTNTTSTSTLNQTFKIDESSTPVYEEVNKN